MKLTPDIKVKELTLTFGKRIIGTGFCKVVDFPAFLISIKKFKFIFVYKPRLTFPNLSLYYYEPMYVMKFNLFVTLGGFFEIKKKPKINPLELEIFLKVLINAVLLYYIITKIYQ